MPTQPTNKHARMTAFVAELGADPASAQHPCLQGYVRLFDAGRYYEAHDVLEHLWLETPRGEPDFAFYQGLIQLAGAFVHLQKQFHDPAHPKHGRRLAPAARLFDLAAANLAWSAPSRHGLDVAALLRLCAEHTRALSASGFTRNPWSPGRTFAIPSSEVRHDAAGSRDGCSRDGKASRGSPHP